jgi:Holliday junction resolvasome RuvABC endonuclease subunit
VHITATRIIENFPAKGKSKGSQSLADINRSSILYSSVKCFIDELMHLEGTKVLAFEVPCGSQSQRAAACLGMAKGVLGSVLSIASTRDYEPGSWMRASIMPSEVHKRVTGKIKADKEQIMQYVLDKYSSIIKKIEKRFIVYLCDKPIERYTKGQFEHIADAIVLAEIGFERLEKA